MIKRNQLLVCIGTCFIAVMLLVVVRLVLANTQAIEFTDKTPITNTSALGRDSENASFNTDASLVTYSNNSDFNSEGTVDDQWEYFDDFSDSNSGWPRVWGNTRAALYQINPDEAPDCPGSDCIYDDGNGYIIIRRNSSDPQARFGPGVKIPSNYYQIEIDARWWDTQYYAAYQIFFGSDNPFNDPDDLSGNYYALQVRINTFSDNCEYSLIEHKVTRGSGSTSYLVNWTKEDKINCGQQHRNTSKSWNHWMIKREGSSIQIYVNGDLLATKSDSSYGANRYFGLGCTIYEGLTPSKPEFDNILVKVNPQAIVSNPKTRITTASDTGRDSVNASLNVDASLVAFSSDSDLLCQGIPDDQNEIWLYDTIEMTFKRVTTASASDKQSVFPILNADGTVIAFSSNSVILPEDISPPETIEAWLYDISTKIFFRLTNSEEDRESWSEAINADGTKIAIVSDADFNDEGIESGQWEIWLYDTTVPTKTRITHASEPNRQSGGPTLNDDGTLLAFSTDSDLLGQGIENDQNEIWLYDTILKVFKRVTIASDATRGSYDPKLNGDGTKLVFTSDSDFHGEGIPRYQNEVWLYDIASEELTRITTAANGVGDCHYPVINSDGSRIVFSSDSDYFSEGIPQAQFELWQYQVYSGDLSRVTFASEVQRDSFNPSLNSDGSMVAFHSDSDFKGQGIPSQQFEIWLFKLPDPSPKLVKMVDEPYPMPGQTITFTITVFNPLADKLTGVVISDTLPTQLDFIGPVILEPHQPNADLAADLGDLPVLAAGVEITTGERVTLTFPVMVDDKVMWGEVFTNTASIISNQTPDPNSGSVILNVFFRVFGVDPEQNSFDAPLDSNLTMISNVEPDKNTINSDTVPVYGGYHGKMIGVYGTGSIYFNPSLDLFPGELVQTTVSNGVETIDDEPIKPFVWEFRAAAGEGPGVFISHPEKHFLPTYQTIEAGLGDLDGDGDLDVIVTGSQHQSVWMNDGTGLFTAHSTTPTFGEGGGRAISLGDMDSDGDLDAVVTNNVTDTVWMNNGDGGMTPHTDSPEFDTGEGYDNALGDIDGDGDLDVIVGRNNGGATVWVNDGKGNLVPHPTNPVIGSGDSYELEIGDVDNDGDLDVLIAYMDLQKNIVWENDGLGNFSSLNVFGYPGCNGLGVGDIDGDGDLDAIAAYSGDPASVWLNNGLGSFSLHPTRPTFGDGGNEVTVGDIDGDGDLDAIIPRFNQLSQTVWLNDGAGNFSPHPQFPEFGGGYTMQVSLGDLDGDGDLDAICTDNSSLDTSIWLNRLNQIMLPLILKGV